MMLGRRLATLRISWAFRMEGRRHTICSKCMVPISVVSAVYVLALVDTALAGAPKQEKGQKHAQAHAGYSIPAGGCCVGGCAGILSVGEYAFRDCTNLTGANFQGNAPAADSSVFSGDPRATVHYLAGTTGWGATFGGVPTVLGNSQQGPFNYTNNTGAITITAYTGPGASVTVPSTINGLAVIGIGEKAFSGCASLTSVTIPGSITSIGEYAFLGCTNLAAVYFQGSAPTAGVSVFDGDTKAIVYYLAGTTGWGATFDGFPTVLSSSGAQPSMTSFAVRTNQFGFTITGASNLLVVVEASASLVNPAWSPLQTNTLTGGSSYFSDPQWTNYPARFDRLRSP